MDEILSHIQVNWRDMSGDDCIPVQVALKLMDPSSLGLADKEADFQQTHVDLQRTLKGIVNEHHQDFNSSIGAYHKIQGSIQASQSRVRYLKQSLGTAQSGLLTTKPELRGLASSSQDLDDVLQLLAQIESIQSVPERLEAQISEKKFLTAVDGLKEARSLVQKPELDEIGAIVDLRTYFSGQERSLSEILVEELHDHLYLKSPYCQERWKPQSAVTHGKDTPTAMAASNTNPWDKPVYHYLANLDTRTPMVDDSSRNPEADSFYYIHMIVEALSRLDHLQDAVATIEQRMPIEMYKVVDKTNHEIDVQYPSHLRGQVINEGRIMLPSQADSKADKVLSEFLWTLYAKFEAIAEGHRVLHEVITGVVAREQLSPAEKYVGSFKELWKLYQLEMRSLLHDYLAPGGESSVRNGMSSTTNGDVFTRTQRDKSKRMFKLSEMDSKSADLANEEEQLDEILKMSVPGLVSKTRGKTGSTYTSDNTIQDSSAAGHKLLVQPNVFNMTYLLPPSLSFLQRLKDIVPAGANIAMSTLTSFLDDFLINIFHPQLEEAVTELCAQCMIDLDSFTQDSQWAQYSTRPIFKGTTSFMTLIRAFSGMLSAIPRDQIFTQLIISQLVLYYDKCYGYYKILASRLVESPSAPNKSTRTLKAAAALAEKGDVHDLASDMIKRMMESNQSVDYTRLVDKEALSLLASTKISPLSAFDIISDSRSVKNLAVLYNSTQWLSSCLAQLRSVEASSSSSTGGHHSRNPSQSRRWTLVSSLKSMSDSSTTRVQLPLSAESVIAFDQTLEQFRKLAQTALITLHVDVRCSITYQLRRSLMGSAATSQVQPASPSTGEDDTAASSDPTLYDWVLSGSPASASPLVLELNRELISFDTSISSYLGPRERQFITNGLGRLVDRVLIVGADWIKVMNEYGAQRLQIDGLVIQQNLRNITMVTSASQTNSDVEGSNRGLILKTPSSTHTDDSLTTSHQYYELFLKGPERILNFVKDKKKSTLSASRSPARKPNSAGVPDLEAAVGYTYDELRTLIELCYSVRLKSANWEEGVKAKRAMGDHLMTLGELMWDSGAPGLAPTVSAASAASAASGRNADSGGLGVRPALNRGRSGEKGLLGMEQSEVFYDA